DPDDPEQERLLARHTGIAFGVEDLQRTYEAWLSRGVRFPLPPTKQPWGGILSMFSDPEGDVMYLDQLRAER
ncbi:MAG: VOC family protein, partial [Candidatus Binataceae bacterium]